MYELLQNLLSFDFLRWVSDVFCLQCLIIMIQLLRSKLVADSVFELTISASWFIQNMHLTHGK